MGRACSTDGEMRNADNIFFQNLKGRDNLEDVGIDGKII
jgi:hypothetical protein